jgi:uncharacterized membrane protein YcgQ (UPF0703/DUF1980 family)
MGPPLGDQIANQVEGQDSNRKQGVEDTEESGSQAEDSFSEKKPMAMTDTHSIRKEDLPVLAPRVPSGLAPG